MRNPWRAAPAILGAIATTIWPDILAYVALISLIIIIIDPLIDHYYMARVKEASKIAEEFDCMVLSIPWDRFTVGDLVEPEDVREALRYAAEAVRERELPLISQTM